MLKIIGFCSYSEQTSKMLYLPNTEQIQIRNSSAGGWSVTELGKLRM
ncbi:MAG: hypothetical protein HDT30_14465 [Clostridiales bacterium]|nr:hypothetical protein [Clostridiales bacterium]